MKNIILILIFLSGFTINAQEFEIITKMECNNSIIIEGDSIQKVEQKNEITYTESYIIIKNKVTGTEMKFEVWTEMENFVDTYRQGGTSYWMNFFQPKYFLNNKPQGQIINIIINNLNNTIIVNMEEKIMIFK